MAFSVVLSAGIRGMHVELVHVEADISNGLPVFHMVGYLSSEVKEAAERVRTAIRNADIVLPAKKIMVNLAPATMRKKGASYDLPIALAVLASLGVIPKEELERVLVIGELSLSGHVRKVSGILPIVKRAPGCGMSYLHPAPGKSDRRKSGRRDPYDRGFSPEGSSGVFDSYSGTRSFSRPGGKRRNRRCGGRTDRIFGFRPGKRATGCEAGGRGGGGRRGIIFCWWGPPGSGKSMIARRIPHNPAAAHGRREYGDYHGLQYPGYGG